MTRREFVVKGAAGAVALPAAPPKPVVAAHAWVYAAPLPRYDFTPVLEDIFRDLTYAGVEAVELMDRALRHDDAVSRIGDLSGRYKLPVIGTSYDGGGLWDRTKHTSILDDAALVLERAGKLGGRVFGLSVGDAGRKKTPEELDAQGEMVKKLQDLARGHRIVLNLHNHTYEVRDGEHDLRGTLLRVPDVKLGPDLDWLTAAGINPVDFVNRHGKRIVYLHLRDRSVNGKWTEAMGEGAIDYPAVGKSLRSVGFSGDAAIELAHERGFRLTRPLRESWKISREYVRRVLGY